MILSRPFKRTIAATIYAAMVCAFSAEQARAGRPYVVSESAGGRIWRIQDVNNDGDALDFGERVLWCEGFASARGMAANNLAVVAIEAGLAAGSNQVVLVRDTNNDGDALDVGERTIWLDALNNPRDVSVDATGVAFISEFTNNQIWRLVDLNNDGDVADLGERSLFADAVSGPNMIVPQGNALLVSAEVGDQIHRLVDHNGDGDVLDLEENLAVTPNYDQIVGVLGDGLGGMYFSSFSTDTVYHARDKNGDGDMMDVAEVLSYADPAFGFLDGPSGLVAYDGGGFLVADTNNNQLKRLRDRNGDGDALDLGEVVVFADGISSPADIVPWPFGLPGDFNNDGSVDAADYVAWRKNNGSQTDYNTWRSNYGRPPGSGRGSAAGIQAAVPEPASAWLLIVGTVIATWRGRRIASHVPSSR